MITVVADFRRLRFRRVAPGVPPSVERSRTRRGWVVSGLSDVVRQLPSPPLLNKEAQVTKIPDENQQTQSMMGQPKGITAKRGNCVSLPALHSAHRAD